VKGPSLIVLTAATLLAGSTLVMIINADVFLFFMSCLDPSEVIE
jgi:hypothetical protein